LNVNKAQGPDGICGRVLRCCADQLGSVFCHLFQLSLDTCHIPALWKFSNVVPLPKKTNPEGQGRYAKAGARAVKFSAVF